MSIELYTPPHCQTLEHAAEPQIRLGIQGYWNTGKTWAALTFPNPIVLNLDRGLGAHTGRSDVIEIPFYDQTFCKKLNPNYKPDMLKDEIVQWLNKEGRKLLPTQTLVVDSNTSLQNAYHAWYQKNKVVTRSGDEDGFAEYKFKKQYYTEIVELFKSLPCNIIFLLHETEASIGKLSGKLRPLLSGQFADELGSHFTDYFRQLTCDKPKDLAAIEPAQLKAWDMAKEEFKAMCDSYTRNTLYYWQLEGDNIFDAKCSSLVNFPRYLPANYQSFLKYRRKTNNNQTVT